MSFRKFICQVEGKDYDPNIRKAEEPRPRLDTLNEFLLRNSAWRQRNGAEDVVASGHAEGRPYRGAIEVGVHVNTASSSGHRDSRTELGLRYSQSERQEHLRSYLECIRDRPEGSIPSRFVWIDGDGDLCSSPTPPLTRAAFECTESQFLDIIALELERYELVCEATY